MVGWSTSHRSPPVSIQPILAVVMFPTSVAPLACNPLPPFSSSIVYISIFAIFLQTAVNCSVVVVVRACAQSAAEATLLCVAQFARLNDKLPSTAIIWSIPHGVFFHQIVLLSPRNVASKSPCPPNAREKKLLTKREEKRRCRRRKQMPRKREACRHRLM